MAYLNATFLRTIYRSTFIHGGALALIALLSHTHALAATPDHQQLASSQAENSQLATGQRSLSSRRKLDPTWDRLTQTPLYFQFQVGSSSETDFPEATILFDYEASEENNLVGAFSVGKKVSDSILVWPFDLVLYASIQHFDNRGYQPDGWGLTLFAKAYQRFDLPYINFPMRLGFGQGLSYTSRIPVSEVRDFHPHESQKLIYYLDYTLQTSLSHLIGRNSWSSGIKDIYVGYTVWHRSSFFGLFAETTGGTNYLGLSIETVTR